MPVVDWGRRPYLDALEEMRRLARERQRGALPDTLILVEHPPVVTVGVEGDDGGAEAVGVPVVHVERGGKATYHGPGQLVGYPIVDLAARGRDVRRFVHDLEAMIADAIRPLGVSAGSVAGRRGVWVAGERKIASVGLAVERWVTFHGFALNVDLDLAPFRAFRPCGFHGEIMTTIARELGRPVRLDEVAPRLRAAWAERFEPPPSASAEPPRIVPAA